jgi:hypothetical protein
MVTPGVGGFRPNVSQPNSPISPNQASIESGGVRPGIGVQKAPAGATEAPAAQAPVKIPIETIMRKMSLNDIMQQLISNGFPANEETRSLATMALMHGLELSKDNLNKLMALLPKNATPAEKEAAILVLLKGMDQQPGAMQILSNFLTKNPALGQQLLNYLNGQTQLQALLHQASGLDPQFSAQLSAILAQLGDEFMGLPGKLTGKKGSFSSSELSNNIRAAKSLMQGLIEKLESQPATQQNQQLINQLKANAQKLGDITEQLVAQSILSKPNLQEDAALPDKFAYWQIPNTMGTPPRETEILIRRDKKNKNRINPNNTKIVLKMETAELGSLGIELDVADRNLNVQFHTLADDVRSMIVGGSEDLKKRMAAQNYKMQTLQVIRKNLDTKKYLIPTLDLDRLRRIQTEA